MGIFATPICLNYRTNHGIKKSIDNDIFFWKKNDNDIPSKKRGNYGLRRSWWTITHFYMHGKEVVSLDGERKGTRAGIEVGESMWNEAYNKY